MAISPLLKSKINQSNNQIPEQEKTYESLKNHANDVRPNAPKARLVNENLGQSIKSYFSDTKQDFVNLGKTVKTGEMSDNNIGRLNDLGMKLGGLLTATFLALHSRSKQESIMRFVGTGAFFASMKLWPKIFINLPSKLIHNVDPGKKYISAQGDKKDFYLDNQFLPWDITNIDDEKERRRHQKVALQNRTLWMATAGVAVPTMTALISNRLEPVVARSIALADSLKVNLLSKKPNGIESYIQPKKAVAQNQEEVANLCKKYAKNPLSPEFAEELKEYLRIDEHVFKDPDWAKTITDFRPGDLGDALKETWKETAEHTFTVDEFKDCLERLTRKTEGFGLSETGEEVASSAKEQIKAMFSEDEVKTMTSSIFGDETKKAVTYKDIEKAIDNLGGKIPSGSEQVQKCLKGIIWNSEPFFEAIKDYHKNFIPEVNGRISNYLKLANPIFGSTADSVYTNSFTRTMDNLFKGLDFSIDSGNSFIYKIKDYIKINVLRQNPDVVRATGHTSLKDIIGKDSEVCTDSLVSYFKALVEDVPYGSSEYESLIHGLTKTHISDSEFRAAKTVSNPENIGLIAKGKGIPALNRAVLGDINGSATNVISRYASEQRTNINATISRLALCANFESRLKEGLIKIDGVDLRELPDALAIARKIVYEANPSQMVVNNSAGSISKSQYWKVFNEIYSEDALKHEPDFVKRSIGKVTSYIRKNDGLDAVDDYLSHSDLTGLVKKHAEMLYPAKSWLKKAGIASIAVIAITLLVQPLFGNIKKEFPNEDNKNNKNDKKEAEKKGGVN